MYYISTCIERNFDFVASLCSGGDWFESHFVRNPEDWFSCDKAHIDIILNNGVARTLKSYADQRETTVSSNNSLQLRPLSKWELS